MLQRLAPYACKIRTQIPFYEPTEPDEHERTPYWL